MLLSVRTCIEASGIGHGDRLKAGVTVAASLAAAAVAVGFVGRLVAKWRRRRRMRAALAAKRAARRRNKAEFADYLARQAPPMSDSEEADIAGLTARQLVERLRAGTLRPDRVLLAFQRRAFRLDQRLNCVAEFLTPDLAEVNLAGPLAGLPVSLKENFSLKGLDSCVGCAAFVDQPFEEDCLAVRQLKSLGGVPFVRTVVPQTMLSVISSNPIDGTVRNPADPQRCPGGSSSGEGALTAGGGSPLGFGSDIGGSIRTPAGWCGGAGLKPTSGRISRVGMRSAGPQRLIESAWGPMAPDVDALVLYMEVLLAGSASATLQGPLTDATLPPLGFDKAAATDSRPMRIGYFVNHGQLRAAPCMERAVLLARDLLAARGHHLVPWDVETLLVDFPILETYIRCVWSDAGVHVRSFVQHDAVSPSIANFHAVLNVPVSLRGCLSACLRLAGKKDAALAVRCLCGLGSVPELWRFAQRMHDHRAAFLRAWQTAGLDALLCPANATAAPPLDDQTVTVPCLAYNVLFNLFNMPAGVLPVTKVTQADLDALADWQQGGWEPHVVAMQRGSLGLPVAVQCAALPWREELCLRLMREVEAAAAGAQRDL